MIRIPQYNDDRSGKRELKKAGDLLFRFKHLLVDSEGARSGIVEALAEHGIRITAQNVMIKGTTAFVKLPPAGRNELFLKQGRIMESLRQNPLTSKIERVK